MMVKMACVGAGYFAPFHVEAWTRIPGVQIAAIVDMDLSKARALANRYQVDHTFQTLEQMFDELKVDVVDIITPPGTHMDLVKQCLQAAVHIICQKPLAPNFEEAEQLINLVSNTSSRFMVHENFRFQPWYRKIKQVVDQGHLGKQIFTAHFHMRMGDGWSADAYLDRQPYFRQMPRLLIHETGVHFIDVIRYLFGEISSVYADLRTLNPNIAGEDFGMVWFKAKNKVRILYEGNRYNESTSENARYTFGTSMIDGEKGTIRLYLDGKLTLKLLGENEIDIPYEHQDINFAGDCVYFTQRHFIDCLLNDKPFENEAQDYRQNLLIQEAVYQSSATQKVVDI